MHKHETILYWSNEDRAFIAEAPELSGCKAHGDDRDLPHGVHGHPGNAGEETS